MAVYTRIRGHGSITAGGQYEVGAMIKELVLQFGGAPEDGPLTFAPGPLTVVVGPNNAGKSLFLREVGRALVGWNPLSPPPPGQIVHTLAPTTACTADVLRLFGIPDTAALALRAPEECFPTRPGLGSELFGNQGGEILTATAIGNLTAALEGPAEPAGSAHAVALRLTSLLLRATTVFLDGLSRLRLTEPVSVDPARSLHDRPPLGPLLHDAAARARLRRGTLAVLGRAFVLDPATIYGQLEVRLAGREPDDEDEELGHSRRARDFHAAATPLATTSDGVRAYVGTLLALHATPWRTILIDEPDAFLHPPLARELGAALATAAAEQSSVALAATHSADFLLGCLQSGQPVNILRLTYFDGNGTARLLPGVAVRDLFRDPLLRATGIVDALFHRGAIICEGDSDRVFYEELNYRLQADGRGARDVRIARAQGKDTIWKVVEALRRLGVPAAAVVDLDFLLDGDVRRLLRAAGAPEALVQSLAFHKDQLVAASRAEGADLRRHGFADLTADSRAVADALLTGLADYGVFPVPVGAVEGWLRELAVPGEKTFWLVGMLARLGSDPADPSYVRPAPPEPEPAPSAETVWTFVERVGRWLDNPRRRGLPSAGASVRPPAT